ncbi:hypothetical protein CASFOL_016538 [Castilleja foliolosa]|uniref:GH16 domain-containing protein n=1 Tax=Castilleja foliolosa TaxID=1961234 RepID=A0ABD3D8I8_9LAMI
MPFFVDEIPIRVFKNNERVGSRYLKLPMYIRASLWNGTQWLGPVNWSRGPFIANYRDFEVLGCPYDNSNPKECESLRYPWNAQDMWQLDPRQQEHYNNYTKTNIIYDYCKTNSRNSFPECKI